MTWQVESDAPSTRIHDPVLDKLIYQDAATGHAARSKIYHQIFPYMSGKAEMPFLCAVPSYRMASERAHGPGLGSPAYNNVRIGWPDVWLST